MEQSKLTLKTKVNITTLIGKRSEEYNMTLERIGFTQDELDNKSVDEIEEMLKKKFGGWTVEWVEFE